ncbi:MAG: DUF6951 family protein [Bacillota bacterium]
MAIVEINSGICGFITRVEIKKVDKRAVEVSIETDCPNIKKVAGGLKTIKPLKEMFCKLHETETYKSLLSGIVHPACIVPSGILKGIEVTAELALPKDSYIRIIL